MKYQNDWHLKKNADVLTSLGTDLYKGLSVNGCNQCGQNKQAALYQSGILRKM